MQARHQLKQYEGRIKNIEEEHKQVSVCVYFSADD